ncbi:pyridoxamine 5'-phosphate oxidase family protein [uncultured Sphaerochaeta sp.]|uniref:pyridoxamine 5'-phosphate oxidase family protein n=1 Tax=uncultured Sphaerochaeta sp. TaxID=886478 RepID=UPI002A0A2026|nr:pyridoxamine 5'-phosphate oxidase family protein [uncultured Sphaerochaeta sp.]
MKTNYAINIENQDIVIQYPDGTQQKLTVQNFPEDFLRWQSVSRTKMFEVMEHKDASAIKSMPGHLPTLATSSDGIFPINLSTRGMGVLPKESILSEVSELFIETKRKMADFSQDESLRQRVSVVKDFYADYQNFDAYIVGGLEIFEGQTARNIANNPLVSLLYSGEAPVFPSYQFNGVIRIVSDSDPYYQFLLAARELFAMDKFHIHQTNYPFGYLFYLHDAKNKTPFSRK